VSLVELARYGTRVEADLVRLALWQSEIDAVFFDAETTGFFGGGGLVEVRLMVNEEDADAAADILAAS
jgi:hypothetical protein